MRDEYQEDPLLTDPLEVEYTLFQSIAESNDNQPGRQ